MNKTIFSLSSLMLLSSLCFAQGQVKEDFQPSELNQPGQQYPMVNSQGYARFCIKAPDAKAVNVSLGLGGQGGKDQQIGLIEGPLGAGTDAAVLMHQHAQDHQRNTGQQDDRRIVLQHDLITPK